MDYDTAINFILAGRDTTAVTLTWCTYELFRDGGEYAKKLKKAIIKNNDIFLKWVIWETLRLHPPVPLEYKQCVKSTTLPSGLKMDPYEIIGYSPYVCGHKDDGTWGDSPEKFIPERWKNIPFDNELQYKLPVFNGGRRVCMGKELALTEIKVFITKLVKNFNLEIINTEVKQNVNLVSGVKNGLHVRKL